MVQWRGTVYRRPDIAGAILGAGAALYLLLCIPAIGQRGYPPIDPVWAGVTYLWIAFIPLSAIFDRPKGWRRWRLLIVYALITAFIDAGTMVVVVPRHVDLLYMLVGTIVFGPLHVMVAVLVEAVSQLVLSFMRRLKAGAYVAPDPARDNGLGVWVFGLAVFVAVVAFPIGYRQLAFEGASFLGRRTADEDWDGQRVALRVWDYPEVVPAQDIRVAYQIDEATGLPFRLRGDDLGFAAAYNQRVQERVAAEGIPSWSMKSKWIEADQLAAMLSEGAFQEVKEVPFDVTPAIVVFRQGMVSRWGSTFGDTMSSGADGLNIGVKPGGLYGVGGSRRPIYVGRDPRNDSTVLIRHGNHWIGAFGEDGQIIATASRDGS